MARNHARHGGKDRSNAGKQMQMQIRSKVSSRDRQMKTSQPRAETHQTDLAGGKMTAKANKQGAYGKVVTHSHSKLEQLMQVSEVAAGLYLKFGGVLKSNLDTSDPDLAFCDVKLGEVSRSFAAVNTLPTFPGRDPFI